MKRGVFNSGNSERVERNMKFKKEPPPRPSTLQYSHFHWEFDIKRWTRLLRKSLFIKELTFHGQKDCYMDIFITKPHKFISREVVMTR